MGDEELIIVGGGGHAAVVGESALAAGHRLAGFLDDDESCSLEPACLGVPRLGALSSAEALAGKNWILAVGDLALRQSLLDHPAFLEDRARTVIHPSAIISPSALIGVGVFVGPGAVVHSRAIIGDHAILNTRCVIEHDCVVGENTHIAPNATLGGHASVAGDCLIGLCASVLPGLRVERGATVGSGAVVTREVPAMIKVAGVPARLVETR